MGKVSSASEERGGIVPATVCGVVGTDCSVSSPAFRVSFLSKFRRFAAAQLDRMLQRFRQSLCVTHVIHNQPALVGF